MHDEKAKTDWEKREAEQKAKSEADEVKSRTMEAEIFKKELAMSFLNEAYFSDKKTVHEGMVAVKDVAAKHLKDNSDV